LRGFAAASALIAICMLAAMGLSVSKLAATNQATRYQQLYMDQAYMISHASFEYAMRRIRVDDDFWIMPTRQFMGVTLTPTRSSAKIRKTSTYGTASNTFSITDPDPPNEAMCFIPVTTGAVQSDSDFRMYGITIQRDSVLCDGVTLTVTGMTVSWTGAHVSERLRIIEFDPSQPQQYNGNPGLNSGGTFDFGVNDFVLTDNNVHSISYLQWSKKLDPPKTITLTFIFGDGSTKTTTATL